jgi:16S rRNA (adenine1518-N6/adenine1519-N6)-dimethyltransferase
MKLSEIKQILAANRLRLTKSLGQNFLHDGNQLRRVIHSAQLKSSDQVLEIGPGLGALTELLLNLAGHLLAIETDPRLVEILTQRFAHDKKFALVHADALDYLQTHSCDWNHWKVVSNLPYSVASPILVELALTDACPERMVITLQLEVAQRLLARAGDENYGLLSLLVQLQYQPRDWFRIAASCFFPVPEVDSACLQLIRREPPLLTEAQKKIFVQIVKRSFSQRRKVMFKLLKQDWPVDSLAPAFEKLGISRRARAETINLDQFVKLTRILLAGL